MWKFRFSAMAGPLAAAVLGFATGANSAQTVTAAPAEVRKIAAEAYLYGFPIVDSYSTLYAQAVNAGGPDYKAPFNRIGNTANVFTPEDKAIITPNSDTPYSFVWMDLRAEPIVLTLPEVDPKRYYSVQLIDLYTHNFAYLGRRTTGSNGGNFLIAGPNWTGSAPAGITKVIRSESDIVYALYRTQLFNDRDLANVSKVQAGYRVQPLSAFAGTAAPAVPVAINWPKPSTDMLDTAALFPYLNFLLSFAPTHPSEVELMKRFATIGIGAGKPFDLSRLSPETKAAFEAGVADGKQQFAAFKRSQVDTKKVSSADFFGTREHLQNNYMYRFAGARLGIYGNSGAEAIYSGYFVDADGMPADASKHHYVLRFPKDGLPPNDAFWSMTMYDGKSQLLVANPLKRYLVNSAMEPQLKRDPDGALTLYVQAESPGLDKESNWLPAPKGPFYAVLRIYQPGTAVQTGTWPVPKLQKAD
jgi:hypothetical protein